MGLREAMRTLGIRVPRPVNLNFVSIVLWRSKLGSSSIKWDKLCHPSQEEVSDFVSSKNLMMLSWQSRFGNSWGIKTHFYINSSKQNFSHLVQSWKPKNQMDLTLGRAF